MGNAPGSNRKIIWQPVGLQDSLFGYIQSRFLAVLQTANIKFTLNPGRCPGLLQFKTFGPFALIQNNYVQLLGGLLQRLLKDDAASGRRNCFPILITNSFCTVCVYMHTLSKNTISITQAFKKSPVFLC